MRRFAVREFQAPGLDARPGEILVPTEIGDPVRGPLKCPAAPFVAGTLRRKVRPVRFVTAPQFQDLQYDSDGAALFMATCQQREGTTVALAAAASPADRLAVAVARSAVEEWAAVLATRRLLLAAGPWCEGAQRALATAEQAVSAAEGQGRSVHVYGQLAATEQAATALAGRGVIFASSLSGLPAEGTVLFPAHGVPPEVRDEALARGLDIIDATCPLVAMAQAEARRLAIQGDQLVLIGQPEYPAAAAIAGNAGETAAVVASTAGIAALQAPDPRRIAYLLQPGIRSQETAPVAAALRSRFPGARGPHPDGFCYAATDRADSIRLIAARADLVLILGTESADTHQLSRLAVDCGTRARVIAHPGEITAAMIAGTASLGIAEATSARSGLAAEVTAALAGLGPLSVVRRQVTTAIEGQPALPRSHQRAISAP